MKKQIGIITFHMACNYGAVLQTYGLQEKLKQLFPEDDIEIIDYYCPAIEDRTKIFYFLRTGNLIRDILRYIVKFIPKCIKIHKFKMFRHKYLNSSHNRFNKDNISSAGDRYDVLVTGSDQVMNVLSTKFDYNYFLNFATEGTVKFSYAASFGFENIFENNKSDILTRLKRFDRISLREDIGYNEIQAKSNFKVEINVDPTLLLTKKDWDKIRENKHLDEDYILVYCILPPNHLLNKVREIAKKENLKVYYISDDIINNDFKHLRNLSVSEFINWIANAKYIATTSFHGTVFSILYNKDFFVEYDTKLNYNYRVEHFLELLGIKGRNIEYDYFNYSSKIDWTRVENILNEERDKSNKYLKSIDQFIKKDMDKV